MPIVQYIGQLALTLIGQLAILCVMENDTLIKELETYSALRGLGVSTVCLKALNNSRFADRYERGKKKMAADAKSLRKFMADNPPISEGV